MIDKASVDTKAQKNRFYLKSETNERLDRWVDKINSNLKGVTVKRSDLINWIIGNHPDELGPKELVSITKEFYSESAFTVWALETVKEALARGEATTLADVMRMRPEGAPVASERSSKTKIVLPKISRPHTDNAPRADEISDSISSKS